MSALAVDAVSVTLGGLAVLKDISAAFNPGQVTAIVGPNGAGKSTLLTLLAGLRRPRSGRVTLDGQALHAMPDRTRARRIGYLPQTVEIAWPLEARTLVSLGLTPYLGAGRPSAVEARAVDVAMDAVGVTDLADRRVDTLSGGERARVLLARAMVGDPEWLLADEPLAGLDPAHVLEVCAVFRRRADTGRGVILTLHDLTTAWRLADRIIVIAEGGLVADGAPQDALTASVLAQAYGVQARITHSDAGGLIDIVGPVT